MRLTAERDRWLAFREPEGGVCGCCGQERDITAITVHEGGLERGTVTVCGTCISAALAVRFASVQGQSPPDFRRVQL